MRTGQTQQIGQIARRWTLGVGRLPGPGAHAGQSRGHPKPCNPNDSNTAWTQRYSFIGWASDVGSYLAGNAQTPQ
jgi:hypothetical protein